MGDIIARGMAGKALQGVSPATINSAGIVKPDGSSITIDADGTIHATGSTFPVMSQYKLVLDNNQLKHNNEVVTYEQIKTAVQDETKFVFVYWETIYMLPTLVKDREGELELEAIEFSTTYQIGNKTVNWRIIINENNQVKNNYKNLLDEEMLYDGDISQWEPLEEIKKAPNMSIIKPFKEAVDEALSGLNALKPVVIDIGQSQYVYEGTALPAINVELLKTIYASDKLGVPQILHWSLSGTENNLKVLSSDHIAANYSIDVLVHNQFHCEYVWTADTTGMVNPNVFKGSSAPNAYLKDASINDSILTLTKNDDTSITFTTLSESAVNGLIDAKLEVVENGSY